MLREETRDALIPRTSLSRRSASTDLPVRAPHLHVIALDFDIQAVIDSLKSGLTPPPLRTRRFYRTGQTPEGSTRLIRIAPLVARALQLCDGRHTVEQFSRALAKSFRGDPQVLLPALQNRGFIVMYRSASRAAPSQAGAGSKPAYRPGRVGASPRNHLSIQAR
jgi:hypothetical protein